MVCEAAKPLRGRSPGPRPKRSEAWDQVNDRVKGKKIVCTVGEGGHTIIVLKGMNYVFICPRREREGAASV